MASSPPSYRPGMPVKSAEEAGAAIDWWQEAEPVEVPQALRDDGSEGAPVSAAHLAQRDAAVDALRRRIEGLTGSYLASGTTKSARKVIAASMANCHVTMGSVYVPELLRLPQLEAQKRWHRVVFEAETALFYKPRLPDALALLGFAQINRCQYPEALATLTRVSATPLSKFEIPMAHSVMTDLMETIKQWLRSVPGRWSLIQVKGEEPPPRLAAAYCQSATELYVFGGDGGQTEAAGARLRSMSTSQLSKAVTAMPQERLALLQRRTGFSTEEDPHETLLKLLYTPANLLQDTWALDLQTLRWRNLQPSGAPSPRQGAALWLWDGALYCHGGEGKDCRSFGDLHVLELSAGARAWRRLLPKGAAPPPRYRHCAFVYAGDSYLWGGRVQGDGDTNLYKLSYFWGMLFMAAAAICCAPRLGSLFDGAGMMPPRAPVALASSGVQPASSQ
eukprot:jgi/Tetstr1/433596/TSEL_022861.t1